MLTLGDLSREMPSEENLASFEAVLATEPSDRSAAIMAASLTEQALYVAICSRLADPGEAIQNSWFEDANAPFGTFAAKIKLGRALAIYAEKMEDRLCIIKNVRNVFAHRSIPLDFANPVVHAEVKKLGTRPTHKGDRLTYCAACVAISRLLIEDALKEGGKTMKISFP